MTLRRFARNVILATAASAAMPGAAHAADQAETFKDWAASVKEVNTGEDLRKTCTATTTTADESSMLTLAISNGDVLPPDAYPQITIAASGLPKGEQVPAAFSFGDKRIVAPAMGNGSQLMVNNVKETSLALLQAMAAGSTVDITFAGKPGPTLSLAGFTASYRKLGAWCGFATSDVAK